ncbi:hypothetical protein EZV62_018300 [Acer yangbiense]|uniref:BIRD-IDD transcription factor fourth C2HC zinc finger domain-containing protein n=1 Tax=Acer yangbiense TaxID=1000413 RepID=A0A5C7HIZ8_9ROSI|nr:hypothetical protein EZV62_018300 [Acer yangbiense]
MVRRNGSVRNALRGMLFNLIGKLILRLVAPENTDVTVALSSQGLRIRRRDSFITHRAFCDALAQESARHPPSLSTIGSHLYGNSNNMGLGLSQVGHQLASIKDQTTQSNDILRLGGGGSRSTSQFNHLLPPSIGSSSSFRSPQTMPPPAFFMQESNHNYHEDHQSQQGLLQNKQFHGIMQFPDLQNNTSNPPSGVNLINLNFLSNSSTTSSLNNGNNSNNTNTNLQSSSLLEGSNNLYSNSILNEQISSGVPSLFSSSVQNDSIVNSHMSATALLQKAAQMGSTSSSNNTASLLRSFGSSSSSGSKPNFSGIFGSENDNNLQDLMNSFASGNSSSIFGGGSGGGEVNNAYTTTSGHAQENNTYGRFNANKNSMEPKLHQNLNISSGGSDRTTRDFLGVGQIVRSISGGFAQREKQQQHQQHQQHQQRHGLDVSSLDSERNVSAPTSQSFGGGGGGSFQ